MPMVYSGQAIRNATKIFLPQIRRRIYGEDFPRFGPLAQYFRSSRLVFPFRWQFFDTAKMAESVAVAGVEKFSIKH